VNVAPAVIVEEVEGVPERVWVPDSVCVILPVCVELRVPVELIVADRLPVIVGFAVKVPELEVVGSFDPEAEAVELLEEVEERVTVRVIVLEGVIEGVACAEPETLDVIVWLAVFVLEEVPVVEGVKDEEGVKEGVWLEEAVLEGVSEIV